MLALFIKLVLAHFIGDFLLQPQKWVNHKEKHKHKSQFLYWHILVHLGILLLVLQVNFNYWLGMLVVIVSHFIIDLTKLYLKPILNNRVLFGLDQLAHIIIIALVVSIYEPYQFSINSFYNPTFLLLVTSLLGVTVVSSVIMRTIISKWYLKEGGNGESLKNAGAYIGILERLLVFIFIVTQHWEGIGFLLAAKSVFRFGDLSKAKDRKLTEYILIGSLLSFGLAILFGLGYQHVLRLLELT